MTKRKSRIAQMADANLVIKKRVEEQGAARLEYSNQLGNKLPLKKIHVQNGLEAVRAKRQTRVQIGHYGFYLEILRAARACDRLQRRGGIIDGDNGKTRARQRKRIAARSSRDIQRPPARQDGNGFDHRRLGRSRGHPAMAPFPFFPSIDGHNTRASVNTSTRRAPA